VLARITIFIPVSSHGLRRGSVGLQLVRQRGQRIDVAQRRPYGRRQHGDRAVESRIEAELTAEGMDVAIEDRSDDASLAIDERRA
jgi:hypothetical protein